MIRPPKETFFTSISQAIAASKLHACPLSDIYDYIKLNIPLMTSSASWVITQFIEIIDFY